MLVVVVDDCDLGEQRGCLLQDGTQTPRRHPADSTTARPGKGQGRQGSNEAGVASMGYRQRKPTQAVLRSWRSLESAMMRANVNGADLGRRAGVSKQYVSRIRSGDAPHVSEHVARRIETCLGVERGSLFDYGDGGGVLADDAQAVSP